MVVRFSQLKARLGLGGAPTRTTTLPDEAKERKKFPVASGVLDYFPDAIVAVSDISYSGNEQHNPGQSLRWDRSKSSDEADTMIRHFLQRGSLDTDGKRHTAKMVWRALALLQKEIEEEASATRSEAPLTGDVPLDDFDTKSVIAASKKREEEFARHWFGDDAPTYEAPGQ